MKRLQLVLTLFASAFCLAFLSTGLMAERQPAWDPREDQSALLNQQTSLPSPRDFCVDTKTTVSKWQRTRIFRAVGKGSAETGLLRGVKLSLVSFQAPASVQQPQIQIEPDNTQPNCTFSSVTNGGANASCSTAVTNPPTTSCSVNGNGAIGVTATCSTIAGPMENGGPGQNYCSATPNNAITVSCSSYGAGFGVNTPNSCSAGRQPTLLGKGQSFSCSIDAKQNPGNGAANCSAGLLPGSGPTQCSAGAASGVTKPTQGGSCSASNAGNGQAKGQCSVLTDGAPGTINACSTQQGQVPPSKCSVLSGNAAGGTPMTCSITAGFVNSYCTANFPGRNGNPGGASCSSFPKGLGGCSTIPVGGGVATPPGNNGYCGTPPVNPPW